MLYIFFIYLKILGGKNLIQLVDKQIEIYLVSSLAVSGGRVGRGGVGDAHLSVDNIVTLDPALAGEGNAPVGLGVVTAAGLSLGVVVVVIILNSPVNVVVRDVGVIDGLTAVRVAVRGGGGGGDEGEENNGDL